MIGILEESDMAKKLSKLQMAQQKAEAAAKKTNQKIDELQKEVVFGRWEKADENHTVVRFVTSWATKEEDVERLIELL